MPCMSSQPLHMCATTRSQVLENGSGETFPSFDEGGSIYPNGVDKNPGAIMNLTAHPQSGLNPGSFPVDPKHLSADHAVGLPAGSTRSSR